METRSKTRTRSAPWGTWVKWAKWEDLSSAAASDAQRRRSDEKSRMQRELEEKQRKLAERRRLWLEDQERRRLERIKKNEEKQRLAKLRALSLEETVRNIRENKLRHAELAASNKDSKRATGRPSTRPANGLSRKQSRELELKSLPVSKAQKVTHASEHNPISMRPSPTKPPVAQPAPLDKPAASVAPSQTGAASKETRLPCAPRIKVAPETARVTRHRKPAIPFHY
eukprot:jgi/Mesvir1/14575/Mv05254-RA.1